MTVFYSLARIYLTSNDETTNKNSIDEEDFEPAGQTEGLPENKNGP